MKTASRFWMQPGILFIYGEVLDTLLHQHNAIQLIWPIKEMLCQFSHQSISHSVIINSGIEHKLKMKQGWVILIEPQSKIGEKIEKCLNSDGYKILNELDNFKPPLNFNSSPLHFDLLEPLFNSLDISHDSFSSLNPIRTKDKRIQSLQLKLNQCFEQECIKPEKWLAKDIASDLALSESRFLHLFTQEMHIAWRPYLLWRRLLCAIRSMHNGNTATQSAYQSGFSDSSHLSRTFKSMFGISIRQAQALFKNKPEIR
jgi:AraC-like DNA-binding protein